MVPSSKAELCQAKDDPVVGRCRPTDLLEDPGAGLEGLLDGFDFFPFEEAAWAGFK